MGNCSVKTILGRNGRRLAAALLLACGLLAGQTLADRARAFHSLPSTANRATVVQYANAHKDNSGALAWLTLATAEIDQKQFAEAAKHLETAARRLPELADYSAYLIATCRFELGDYPAVERTLKDVWSHVPASPLVEKAALLEANAALREQKGGIAIALVQQRKADLTEPESEIILAHAFDAMGEHVAAMPHFQRLLVEFPLTPEAADAASDSARLAAIPAQARLARCIRLLEGGDPQRAQHELEEILPNLTGPDHDLAQVKIGVAMLQARSHQAAFEYLSKLKVASPEADAERLYALVRCARRLDRPGDFKASLDLLAAGHPSSIYRLQALWRAGDYFWLENDALYRPLYKACWESFAGHPQSLDCLWRYAFSEYRQRSGDAAELFRTLIKRYPDSDKVTASLYFLGRLAEYQHDPASARAYYDRIASAYPNYFYATQARERLGDSAVARAIPAPAVVEYLQSVAWPQPAQKESFAASEVGRQRNERARLLASAGLDDLAESELRFGARREGQPAVYAIALAELAADRNAPDQGIRYIKQLTPNYLRMAIEPASERFWKLAFPMPYRNPLEQYSIERGLDPFLVAALIRQESEFNPKSISPARAYGLTQVLPSTGREIWRKLNERGFTAAMLFLPEVNLRIGTYYLRTQLDRLQGKLEATLASYNAGPGRVAKWLTWGEFREPAEFIETIPFDETRAYVASVLRNADLYRRLYGVKTVAMEAGHPLAQSK